MIGNVEFESSFSAQNTLSVFACRLDPIEDPLCVLLMIDYYAIKAEEYQYFIQLFDEFEVRRNVSILPNFAYTLALAYFYLEKMDKANNAVGCC